MTETKRFARVGAALHHTGSYIRAHQTRISGAVLLTVTVAAVIGATSTSGSLWPALFLAPLLLGAAIPLASEDKITSRINAWGNSFEQRLQKARGSQGKFSRFFLRPLHWGSVKLWSVSESLQDRHIQAGVRLGTVLYFWSVMLFVLLVATYFIIGIALLLIVLAIAGWILSLSDDSDGVARQRSTPPEKPSSHAGRGFLTGLFAPDECGSCGSKEHATRDCPHGMFASKCGHCGSKNHGSADCPHGWLSSKCGSCGSIDHATVDCPHGVFSSEYGSCGSKNHATGDCPHGVFSSKCAHCGSRDHGTSDCPH